MIPIIKDIKTFLPVARLYKYSFLNKYCTRTIIYDALDCIIIINIDLKSGAISFDCPTINRNIQLEAEDKEYLLKNISHLIKWINPDELEEI